MIQPLSNYSASDHFINPATRYDKGTMMIGRW